MRLRLCGYGYGYNKDMMVPYNIDYRVYTISYGIGTVRCRDGIEDIEQMVRDVRQVSYASCCGTIKI